MSLPDLSTETGMPFMKISIVAILDTRLPLIFSEKPDILIFLSVTPRKGIFLNN
jgi:hypothetical protein